MAKFFSPEEEAVQRSQKLLPEWAIVCTRKNIGKGDWLK
jgi:hypothetical protein